IEPGEVEAVLGSYPGGRDAVVVAREGSPGDRRLVACLVADPTQVTVTALRSHLRATLPEYMVPSAYAFLDALPLSPSGKIDRKALAALQQFSAEPMVGFVAPRTPIEELVAEVWSAVLARQPIGIHDNFFDLGGHSLQATQVVFRLRKLFEV